MTTKHPVRAVMTTPVDQLAPGTPFKAVVALLEARGIGGAPIVDEHGRVLGVVTQADLLTRKLPHRGLGPGARRGRRKAEAVFAADLMSTPAVTVGPDDDVVRAVQLMETHHVHRLPVVDGDGALVGIVARADLLRVFLRPDVDICHEVVGEVLEREMCVDPRTLNVTVHDGIVSISGVVERYSMIPLIAALVRRVDGVVEVREHLKADLDDRGVRQDGPIASGLFGGRSARNP